MTDYLSHIQHNLPVWEVEGLNLGHFPTDKKNSYRVATAQNSVAAGIAFERRGFQLQTFGTNSVGDRQQRFLAGEGTGLAVLLLPLHEQELFLVTLRVVDQPKCQRSICGWGDVRPQPRSLLSYSR